MKLFTTIASLALLAACSASAPGANSQTLEQARAGFVTHASQDDARGNPVERPPARVLQAVKYDAPLGAMSAYITPDPHDGARHPAIIWMTGGDSSTIDGSIWRPAPRDNDQSARAFREAGVVTMYPSLRGGNDNPGHREGFYGEVNDVLAAADYLAKQPYVDPNRIYLGGHSTGGTLVLLVAESSARFRAVFSFGPIADVRQYGGQFIPAGLTDPTELKLRSPAYWQASVRTPTFVLEGDGTPSNQDCLVQLRERTNNPAMHFEPIPGATHFSELAPATALIAQKILADTGPTPNIAFSDGELAALMGAH
jgi:dienelactone hydrolase